MSESTMAAPPAPPTGAPSPSVSPTGVPAPSGAPAPSTGTGTPWFTSWLRNDGTLDATALDKLPDTAKDLKGHLGLFQKFDDFITSTGNLRRVASLKGLTPLRAEATDAEKAAHKTEVRKFFGVPDKPEGYGFKRPDSVPEDMWDDGFAQTMAKAMHDADVPPATAKALFDSYQKYMGEAITAAQGAEQTGAATRLQEMNAKLDGAFGIRRPAMEQLAVRGALAAGLDPNSDAFKNNADVVIALANVARQLGEDKLPRPEGAPGAGLDAEAEYRAMHGDPSNRYYPAIQAMAKGQQHPLAHEAMQRREFLATQIAQRRERGSR